MASSHLLAFSKFKPPAVSFILYTVSSSSSLTSWERKSQASKKGSQNKNGTDSKMSLPAIITLMTLFFATTPVATGHDLIHPAVADMPIPAATFCRRRAFGNCEDEKKKNPEKYPARDLLFPTKPLTIQFNGVKRRMCSAATLSSAAERKSHSDVLKLTHDPVGEGSFDERNDFKCDLKPHRSPKRIELNGKFYSNDPRTDAAFKVTFYTCTFLYFPWPSRENPTYRYEVEVMVLPIIDMKTHSSNYDEQRQPVFHVTVTEYRVAHGEITHDKPDREGLSFSIRYDQRLDLSGKYEVFHSSHLGHSYSGNARKVDRLSSLLLSTTHGLSKNEKHTWEAYAVYQFGDLMINRWNMYHLFSCKITIDPCDGMTDECNSETLLQLVSGEEYPNNLASTENKFVYFETQLTGYFFKDRDYESPGLTSITFSSYPIPSNLFMAAESGTILGEAHVQIYNNWYVFQTYKGDDADLLVIKYFLSRDRSSTTEVKERFKDDRFKRYTTLPQHPNEIGELKLSKTKFVNHWTVGNLPPNPLMQSSRNVELYAKDFIVKLCYDHLYPSSLLFPQSLVNLDKEKDIRRFMIARVSTCSKMSETYVSLGNVPTSSLNS